MAKPLTLTLELESPRGESGLSLSIEQPAKLDQLHELVYAEELRIIDRRRDDAPGLEYGRYRVEAWDEDTLRMTFLCDAFFTVPHT